MNPQGSPQAVESTRRQNIRAADVLALDHCRECPRCHELLNGDAVVCVDCGCSLVAMVETLMPVSPAKGSGL